MRARHTIERNDQRVTGAHRPGAMYVRAEARRAAESQGVGTATMAPRRSRHGRERRTQLAVLAGVWLLIVGITMLVGVRWNRTGGGIPAAEVDRPAAAPVASIAGEAPKPLTASKPVQAVRPAATPPVAAVKPAVARRSAAATASSAAARLVITSSPAGASVTVDGVGWGATPARIRYLPPGTKRVRVTKDGYVTRETAIRVGAGGTTTLNVVLRPRGTSLTRSR